jgi:hypothetical protein
MKIDKEKLIVSTDKKLKVIFYSFLGALVLLGILVSTLHFSFFGLNKSLVVNLQQLLVLCMLGGIPGILIWSKNKMKDLVEISDIGVRLKLYEKYAYIRQSVFFFLGFSALLMQVVTAMKGALILFLVVFCLCMFIVPTRNRLLAETSLMESEPEVEDGTEIEQESNSDPDPKTQFKPKT